MHRIQGYIQIHQLTNQAFRDLFKAGLRQSGKHIHIHADPVIQSRGEEQGRGAGGGGASGRKEQRAGEGTDLGGLGRLQGGAEEQRREADGSPAGRRTGPLQGGGREADGSPGRRTRDGPLQGGAAVEASRGPAGRSSGRREAGGAAAGDAGGGGATGAPRLAREAEARLVVPPRRAVDLLGPLLIPAPARDSFPRRSFPPAHAPCAFPRSRFPPCRTFFDRFRVV